MISSVPFIPVALPVHVVPAGNVWAVEQTHVDEDPREFPTQVQALGYAMTLAKREATELIVHNREGQFRVVYNYANKGYDSLNS